MDLPVNSTLSGKRASEKEECRQTDDGAIISNRTAHSIVRYSHFAAPSFKIEIISISKNLANPYERGGFPFCLGLSAGQDDGSAIVILITESKYFRLKVESHRRGAYSANVPSAIRSNLVGGRQSRVGQHGRSEEQIAARIAAAPRKIG
jgi:hypothetical protein